MHAWYIRKRQPAGNSHHRKGGTTAKMRRREMTATAIAAAPAQSKAPKLAKAAVNQWGQLMAAAQAGNGGAYNRLLSELGPWLTRFYARRLPLSMVDDAMQDTLIAIHQKRHTYDPARPFGPWLAAIARYKWIDRLRAMGRQATVSIDDEIFEPSVEGHETAVTSAVLLEELLSKLKPAQATVIRLVKLQGFSIEDAAGRTGQSESLVKVNIHRGLSKLAAIAQVSG
jgi:RNA polymerase sigma factor (sigma-70 family)